MSNEITRNSDLVEAGIDEFASVVSSESPAEEPKKKRKRRTKAEIEAAKTESK